MQEQSNILDNTLVLSNRNTYPIQNSIDFGISAFLVAIAWLLALVSIVSTESLGLIAILNLFLGFYQLISAFVGGVRGNKKKLGYLVTALVYIMLLITFAHETSKFGSNGWSDLYFFFLILFVPLCMASYYTYLCYQAKNNAQ